MQGLATIYNLVWIAGHWPKISPARPPNLSSIPSPWNPETVSRALPEPSPTLAGAGVQLAHFHLGGNFGWAIRFPNQSRWPSDVSASLLPPRASRREFLMATGSETAALKLAMRPFAWLGKMHSLAHVPAGIASRNSLPQTTPLVFSRRGKFDQIYIPPKDSALRRGNRAQPIILNVAHVALAKANVLPKVRQNRGAHTAGNFAWSGISPRNPRGSRSKYRPRARLEDRIILAGARMTGSTGWIAPQFLRPTLLREALGWRSRKPCSRLSPLHHGRGIPN